MFWHRGETLQIKEIGYRNINTGPLMQKDTLFCIASMIKPVTVAAVMSLLGESKQTLHDPIARWEPELAELQVPDQPDGPLDRTDPAQRAALLEICSPIQAV
ncbi:hypothetical protein A8144_02880 [Mycobacterium leprae 3125609]|nr:serine hydrolase domain-containing protein [Mycobacterium leprae]OAR20212.1 hypothetical protein A8144_02880 [Mycobacterium leprae 3125609]OAX71660.1 hypothetical protein A3216_04480 [Mycobacterium leprae 7935681]